MTTNHPAHGPVSLDRLHQIREHLQHDTQYSDGGNRAYILADVLKVIDGAIAAFSAEPVPCPKCNDTGMADSGGVQPWGEPILIECDCRAAMLQAGNSPVTPDTWIPVSERIPENKPGNYEYIVFESLNNRAHHDYWNVPDGSCDDFSPFWNHYGKYVTHWMPLPAAPQQEVKP